MFKKKAKCLSQTKSKALVPKTSASNTRYTRESMKILNQYASSMEPTNELTRQISECESFGTGPSKE